MAAITAATAFAEKAVIEVPKPNAS